MPLEKYRPRQSYVDVLDRVLNKGFVIDAWLRVSVGGIELVGVKAQVVVSSMQTYVKSSAANAAPRTAACPTSSPRSATVQTPREARRPRRLARRPRTFYQCQHGCTFTLKRRAQETTIVCPFDGGRARALTLAPLT